MKLFAVMFAMFLILATASQAMACGAGGGGNKGGDDIEAVES